MVDCFTPERHFLLLRPPLSQKYTLMRSIKGPLKIDRKDIRDGDAEVQTQPINAGSSLGRLDRVSENMKLEKFSRRNESSSLWDATYTRNSREVIPEGSLLLLETRVILDETNSWCVVEYEQSYSQGVSVTGSYEYSASQKGLPIPATLTETSIGRGDQKYTDTKEVTFEFELGDVPEQEFSLEHYGIKSSTDRTEE